MRAVEREKYPKLYKKHLAFGRSKRGRRLNKRAVKKYVNSEKGKEVRSKYQTGAGAEIHKISVKKYNSSNHGQINRRLWNKGLSKTEKEKARKAWDQFDGRCQCCGRRRITKRGWHLDHKGKKFRGILCHHCNIALGFLNDSVERCNQVISYLEKTK
ncbi:Recombination endonuclease VII [uncultured archaeon]|nr:Recombination endonuclease VII [uncultured archaeon]